MKELERTLHDAFNRTNHHWFIAQTALAIEESWDDVIDHLLVAAGCDPDGKIWKTARVLCKQTAIERIKDRLV